MLGGSTDSRRWAGWAPRPPIGHDPTMERSAEPAIDLLKGRLTAAQVHVQSLVDRPARRVLDHRVTELLLHHHDLGADRGVHGLPDELAWGLLDSLSRTALLADAAPMRWEPTGGPAIVTGEGASGTISGSAAELALWVSGRSDGSKLRGSEPVTPRPAW